MNNIKEEILNCLKDVKGSGKFVTAYTVPFLFPGLEIDGVGELVSCQTNNVCYYIYL